MKKDININLPDDEVNAVDTVFDDKYAMDSEPALSEAVFENVEKPAQIVEDAVEKLDGVSDIAEVVTDAAEPVAETVESGDAAEVVSEIVEEIEAKQEKPAKQKKGRKAKKAAKAAKAEAAAAAENATDIADEAQQAMDEVDKILADVDQAAAEAENKASEEQADVAPVIEAAEEAAPKKEKAPKAPKEKKEGPTFFDKVKAGCGKAVDGAKKLFGKLKGSDAEDGEEVKMGKGTTRIKYRILRLTIISVVASVVVMQVYSIISTINSYQTSYTDQAKALVTSYSLTMDTKLDALFTQLNSLTNNPQLLNATNPNLAIGTRKMAMTQVASSTMFKFLDLVDAEGNTLVETNVADRAYYQRAFGGLNTLSSPLNRRLADTDAVNEFVMILASKLTTADFNGVICGGITPGSFSEGLDSITEGSNVVVLDKDGVVVAATDMALVTNCVSYKKHEDAGLVQLADAMMKGEEGTIRYHAGGVEYLAAYAPIEMTDGWTIAVSLNYTPVMNDIVTNLVISTILSVTVIILICFICVGVANKITKPITQTATRIQKLSEGDISSEFVIKVPNDETKILTDSLTITITELNKYITDIKDVLAEIASGNLTAKSSIEYKGDFEALGISLEEITQSLNESFTAVKDSVDTFKSGAAQVAEGSKHLSDTAIKEAEAVDEILSTIGGITDKANATAQISNQVLGVTNEANDNAQRGADMMKELLAAIENIREKSEAISAIIKTIDNIAFQTNILALNASIEAARAGEAGRGFSVVAEEVGNLANMSADAAKQTSVLINDTISAVKQGTEIADRAENAIKSIAADVDHVASYMDSIVTAANEQNVAVEQITLGIHRIDAGMHTTTATAEQSAASSEQLSNLAVSLANEVSRFKTE